MTIPSRFERPDAAAALHAAYDKLEAGAETGHTVSVAGRVMLLRHQGKLAVAGLRDPAGTIQLFALSAATADFEGFTKLRLGDWVGATGEVVKTRKGELSVKVGEWT